MILRNVLLGLGLIAAAVLPAQAKRIQVDTALSTPVVPAERSYTTFVKIALTGFELEPNGVRAPANVAIVLDKSGSMAGEKIVQAREAAIQAVNMLGREDIVSVVTYDSTVDVIVPATKLVDKAAIVRRISTIQADGNTALFAGVAKGAAEVRKFLSRNRVNRVILLSDGQANVGPSSPRELGELGLSLSKEAISVTTIGLGLGYNEDLMTQLAGFSDGNHAFAKSADDLGPIFEREFGDVLSVVAQEVEITIEVAPGVKPLRVLGRDADILGNQVRTRLNQLYSRQEKFLLLEVEVPPGAAESERPVASVDVAYVNLASKAKERVQDQVSVRYSKSEAEVAKATDAKVVTSAVQQIANEASKEAVRLRDEGKVEEARSVLGRAADYVRSQAAQAPAAAPALEQVEEATRQDAAELEDQGRWNEKRKSLRAKQYKIEKQQNY